MIRLIVGVIMSGNIFAMCDGGPVPDGCCDPGDRLDVVLPSPNEQRCADMGGTLDGVVCVDVDF
jgi:hypothetical protein